MSMSGNTILYEDLPIAALVFFFLFIAISIVHLVFCFLEMDKPRAITKPFCLGTLAIAATIAFPQEWALYLALYAGMVGDIFLIYNKKPAFFFAGTGFFFVNHILFIIEYFLRVPSPAEPAYAYAVGYVAAFFLFALSLYFPSIKIAKKKPTALCGSFYFSVLLLDLTTAIISCCLGNFIWSILGVFGALFFLASDMILSVTTFKEGAKKQNFPIMLTYLAAECLIAVGMGLTIITY